MATDPVSQRPADRGDIYRFRPVTDADFDLLRRWLAADHVRRWWGEADHELPMIRRMMEADWGEAYIVEAEGRPIAYLQAYDAAGAGPDWPDQPPGKAPGTWGLDTFIGPAGAIGKGHGAAFLKAFGDLMLARPEVAQLYADPASDNAASIRAFEKAGFVATDRMATPGGLALKMYRTR